MKKVKFIVGSDTVVAEGETGSVMELAVQNNIDGIDGDCGGVCSCATCHVHVDEAYWDAVGEAGELESDILEFDEKATQYSRLSCQLDLEKIPDGLVVTVAKSAI